MSNRSRLFPPAIGALTLVVGAAVVSLGLQFRGQQQRTDRLDSFGGSTAAGAAVPSAAPATRTMAQIVAEVTERQDPTQLQFMNAVRADMLRTMLADPSANLSTDKRRTLGTLLATELVNAGLTADAVKETEDLIRRTKREDPQAWTKVGARLLILQAIGYLRMGEEQNCCSRNTADSCLLPISGSGVHSKQYGSREAIKRLRAALAMRPGDLSARWLLNIAYMTLGQYPDQVPEQWRIPLRQYGVGTPMRPFYNAAKETGLDLLGWAGGAAFEDFEGDGRLHLMVSSMIPRSPLRYFHNNGDGTFTERTDQMGLSGELGGLNFITTDYNNDGRVDVVLLRGGWFGPNGHYPLSLLRNDGRGRFKNVTLEAGLLTFGPTQTAVSFDYNCDGYLDLFVGYESSGRDRTPCRLFRNKGDGTFADVTEACGIFIARFVKAVGSADYMKSGRPGLYLSCVDGSNILLRNDGPAGLDRSPAAPWRFTEVGKQAGVDRQDASFSCFFFDYDNDTWPDIYVSGYGGVKLVGDVAADYLGIPNTAEKARLYRNNRDGTFTDVSRQAGLHKVVLGMGTNFGDLDNDGWLDFYVGTGNPELGMLIPNRMFRNRGGKAFEEVTLSGNFGHLQKGHGISFADINNDGAQDVFEVMGGAYEGDTARSCLYVNPGGKNRWITLHLTGVRSNRAAVGAEITLTVTTPAGERQVCRTVGPGGSFGNNPLRQEIGLGDATAIRQATIRWPATGEVQTVTGLKPNNFYKIREGESRAEPWQTTSFRLPNRAPVTEKVALRR